MIYLCCSVDHDIPKYSCRNNSWCHRYILHCSDMDFPMDLAGTHFYLQHYTTKLKTQIAQTFANLKQVFCSRKKLSRHVHGRELTEERAAITYTANWATVHQTATYVIHTNPTTLLDGWGLRRSGGRLLGEHCHWFLWSPYVIGQTIIFMVALCNRADHYIFMLWFVLLSFFFFLA